jgi:FlaA1/EpsC-like NDP-sugar epimerase
MSEAPSSPWRSRLSRFWSLLPTLAVDALLVAASYAAALGLRFDGNVPRDSVEFYFQVVGVLAIAYILGNYFFGVYRTAWQYASVGDAITLALAVGTVSVVLIGINVVLDPRHIPLTVTGMAPALIFLSMAGVKLWPRLRAQSPIARLGTPMKQVLIAGAGRTGQMVAREFLQHPEWEFKPVGYVDDDPRKHGQRIHGLAVLGDRNRIPEIVRSQRVEMIALAMPSTDGAIIRDFVGICQQTEASVRIVPGLPEMVHGGAAQGLREITVDDLLGRKEVQIDLSRCADKIRERSVLITGAAGYLGQELCEQLLPLGPSELHLLDVNETALYDLHRDLAANGTEVKMWVADISDRPLIDRVFASAKPDIVFHTAAYKHIPVVESHPEAALQVNVVGTMNVTLAAERNNVDTFIFISSNKAAELDSVYGATKRIGELLIGGVSARSGRSFSSVRLHSVMGSRGSVVPLFLRQIERGGPVLLTHPDIKRHFTSPPEAVRLVVQTAAFARPGEIFVLDLGEEVRIADLAEKLIRLRGFEPGGDIQIVYTGLRPGEQLIEEPLDKRGTFFPTDHPKIYRAGPSRTCSAAEVVERINALEQDLPEREDLVARLHALARLDQRDEPIAIPSDLTGTRQQ